jgi:hypothetical protein
MVRHRQPSYPIHRLGITVMSARKLLRGHSHQRAFRHSLSFCPVVPLLGCLRSNEMSWMRSMGSCP